MSVLISRFRGRLPQVNNWKTVRQYFIISVSPLLLIATVYVWQNMGNDETGNQVLSITSSNSDDGSSPKNPPITPPQTKTIFIDISGSVNQPGIKELAETARVNDAIWSAKGYSLQADKEYIAQVLNLAQPLKDGDKIYIPSYAEVAQSLPKPPVLLNKIKEPITVLSQVDSGSQDDGGSHTTQSDTSVKVNINTATQSQLEALPGIGEVNAKNILEGRPYTSTNELCTRKIITSTSTCEKIQELISI